MAILGVLLGVTMTVLAYLLYQFRENAKADFALFKDLTDRVVLLEKRKALLAEAVTSQPKPVGVAGQKLRTWNEDAPIAEKASR